MARGLSGSGQYLSRADQTELRVAFPIAVSVWFKGAAQGNFKYIVSKLLLAGEHPSYGFASDSTGDLRFYIGWGTSAGNATASPFVASATAFNSAWNHFLGTYDGTTIRLYCNGTEASLGTADTHAISYGASSLYVGSFDGTQLYATGTIAEFTLFNAVPDAAERAALASAYSPLIVKPSAVVGYWPIIGRTSPEIELRQGMSLTVTSATQADHPRVFNRATLWIPPVASAGLSAAVGQVTETDTSQAMGRLKAKAIGQTTETDVSQTITRVKTRVIGQATETDTAQLLSIKMGLIQTTETDTAQALTRRKTKVLGQVTETDVSQALTVVKRRLIGQTTETDSAALFNVKLGIIQVVETDVAQAITGRKTKVIGQPSETDTAQIISAVSFHVINPPTETDVAQLITRHKTKAIGQVTETDVSQALSGIHKKLTGQTTETDSAQALGRAKAKLLGQPAETDVAQIITPSSSKIIAVDRVTEVDSAGVVTETKRLLSGRATEIDLAQSITGRHTTALLRATETDSAQALSSKLIRLINQAAELDRAMSILAPAPGGVDIMSLFNSRVVFDTAAAIVTGVGVALGSGANGTPERIGVVPGSEIAWDACDCGQLAIVIPRRYASNSFPTEASVVRNCENALVVAQLTLGLQRCAPNPSENGDPPKMATLQNAAMNQEEDVFIVRSTTQCILEHLQDVSDVASFTLTTQDSVGPQGGCYGTELTIFVGFYVNCGC
jgi:hypothetical protein